MISEIFMVMIMKTAVFWDVITCSLVDSRHVPHKCWHLWTFQRNVPRCRKLSSTNLHSITFQNSLGIEHPHMLSSFHTSCFSSNGCLLGFYAVLVLTFQRNALPLSSVDWIGPGGWWSDRVEKRTIFCNHTNSAATWPISDTLKMMGGNILLQNSETKFTTWCKNTDEDHHICF